jgi:hypothetical protein
LGNHRGDNQRNNRKRVSSLIDIHHLVDAEAAATPEEITTK